MFRVFFMQIFVYLHSERNTPDRNYYYSTRSDKLLSFTYFEVSSYYVTSYVLGCGLGINQLPYVYVNESASITNGIDIQHFSTNIACDTYREQIRNTLQVIMCNFNLCKMDELRNYVKKVGSINTYRVICTPQCMYINIIAGYFLHTLYT